MKITKLTLFLSNTLKKIFDKIKKIKWRNVTRNGLSIIRIQTHVTFLARFPNKICKRSPPPTLALRLQEERRTNNAQRSSRVSFRPCTTNGKCERDEYTSFGTRDDFVIAWFYWICRRCVYELSHQNELYSAEL